MNIPNIFRQTHLFLWLQRSPFDHFPDSPGQPGHVGLLAQRLPAFGMVPLDPLQPRIAKPLGKIYSYGYL